MGLVPNMRAAAWVIYPEQRREYPLFDHKQTRIINRQLRNTYVRKDPNGDMLFESEKFSWLRRKRTRTCLTVMHNPKALKKNVTIKK